MKTELEKAAEKYNPLKKLDGEFIRQAFKDGAKWQAERIYSEDDMINFAFDTYYYISGLMEVPFNQISENKLHAIENLKQFKKKQQ